MSGPGESKMASSVVRLRGVVSVRGVRPGLLALSRRWTANHGRFREAKEPEEMQATFSNGRSMRLSTGWLARFADGSALAQLGDTTVMATAVGKTLAGSPGSGVPLVVDYRQGASSVGRIPATFRRRETGPSEREVLAGRAVDRCVRPLFPTLAQATDTQVIASVLAADDLHDPVVLAINSASAALAISDIPWDGPVGAVRIARISGGELIVCPTRRERQESTLDMLVCACDQNLILMVEAGCQDVLQQDFMRALKVGVQECQHVVRAVQGLQRKVGKEKRDISHVQPSGGSVAEAVKTLSEARLREIFKDVSHDKKSRDDAVAALRSSVMEQLKAEAPEGSKDAAVSEAFGAVSREVFRSMVLETGGVRCDGRTPGDLRPITCQVGMFPPLPGSAVFQRGQTQVVCSVAFDSPDSAVRADPVGGSNEKNFFLHYEFPPFATNEMGRVGGWGGRREIGHGALAEKALAPLVPSDLPFTTRVWAQVMESNGSSSMATVCAASLAMMDAGLALPSPVGGVAVGLVAKYELTPHGQLDTKHMQDYQLLADILGIEDYMGDMDMKLAGTKKGITAMQLDVKVPGLPLKVIMEGIQLGSDAKSKVLQVMSTTMDHPRDSHEKWPVSDTLQVSPHQRGALVGFGGCNLRRLKAATGVQLEANEDGSFAVFAPNSAAWEEAKDHVKRILEKQAKRTPELEFGAVYSARIVELKETGCLVSLHPDMQPALLHNSQLDQRPVHHPSALGLEVGQTILVKYFGRDPVSGRVRISRKVLQGGSGGPVKDFHPNESTGQ